MDSKLSVPYLDQFVRRVCVVVPEYRGLRLKYPVGSLLLGLLLCECAGCFSQRSKEEWLKEHWHWIKEFWVKSSGQAVKANGTPSQSTISRLLSTFSEATFARLVYKEERSQLWQEWDNYLKASKADSISAKKKKEREATFETSPTVLCRWQGLKGLQELQDGT